MKQTIYLLIFLCGVAVGTISAYRCAEKKYKKIADEEIDSVKEAYRKQNSKSKKSSVENSEENNPTTPNVMEDTKKQEELSNYVKKVEDLGYTNYADIKQRAESRPYVIRPEEAGDKEEEGYYIISLSYYADGVVADDDGEILEDVEGTITEEALTHFGEYEDDSVYVRNDRLKIDYEILMDPRTYAEILKNKPYLRRE